MSTLLELTTPDYVLTVWVRDISNRLQTLHSTLERQQARAVSPNTVLRFDPPLKNGDVKLGGYSQSASNTDNLPLDQPLFFENTEYQFEWVFLNRVEDATLAHRSHALNSSFRFVPARSGMPARLTGNLNTRNDVGWMRLPLRYQRNGKTLEQSIAFEVQPTKMLLQRDLPAMYSDIDEVFPLWRFSLVGQTSQDAASSRQRGNFPLLWLAQFARLREQFEQGLKVIRQAPHNRLQAKVSHIRADRLGGRIAHKIASRVREDMSNGLHDRRYRIEKKHLSVDTPENRFIKMVVNKSRQQLATFERQLRNNNRAPDRQRISDSFLDELQQWQSPLKKMLDQSFLQDVGDYAGMSRESLVLQQKTGYSAVYRAWQELKFYLSAMAGQSQVSMKSVAEIYEIWCFLRIRQILLDDLGFIERQASKNTLELNEFFEYQLKDGFAGAFEFTRADGIRIRLAHEPKFTRSGQPIRSWLTTQKPDIVLEATFPGVGADGRETRFIWLFDAKYRIKTEPDRYDDDTEKEAIKNSDHVPNDAINQMHRYRDALIYLHHDNPAQTQNKSRPVFGAFALYPGFFDQHNNENPYAQAIHEIGIGAFALLPDDGIHHDGSHWLRAFLVEKLGVLSQQATTYDTAIRREQLYVQDSARIPVHGMQQVLYPDLTLTVALGDQKSRSADYFSAFNQGTARWYHLPQKTFEDRFQQHVTNEIRYLALATTSTTEPTTKQIDRIWPVKSVTLVPRNQLNEQQAGKLEPKKTELYYLFELGRPLQLASPILRVPHRPIRNTMKLTTLHLLEQHQLFRDLPVTYPQAFNTTEGNSASPADTKDINSQPTRDSSPP